MSDECRKALKVITVSTEKLLTLHRFSSVGDFYRRAAPFLAREEATHCLPIGICTNYLDNQSAGNDFFMATVERDDEVVTAALMTPPHNLILSLIVPDELTVDALSLLAYDLHAELGVLPGVIAPVPLAQCFADVWSNIAGQPFRLYQHQRIYQLQRVSPVRGVPGRLRLVDRADRDLLARWIYEFNQEALGEGSLADAEVWADRRIASAAHQTFLWEDGAPVALVGCGGRTPNGLRVGPVYTPPKHRRRGYASAATAAVSQRILDQGRRFVFLFTDLANPTSNHIYQEIGFRPIHNVDNYRAT